MSYPSKRYEKVPHIYDPWGERFKFEAKANLGKPFSDGRKGEPMKSRRRKPRGTIHAEQRARRVGSIIWK